MIVNQESFLQIDESNFMWEGGLFHATRIGTESCVMVCIDIGDTTVGTLSVDLASKEVTSRVLEESSAYLMTLLHNQLLSKFQGLA